MKFFVLLACLAIVRAHPRTALSFDRKEAVESRNARQVPQKYLRTVAEVSSDFGSVAPIADLATVSKETAIENTLPTIVATEPKVETTIGNEMMEKASTKRPNFFNKNPSISADFPEIQATFEAIFGPGVQIVDVVQALGYPDEIYYSLDGDELPTVIDNRKRFLKPQQKF